MSYRTLYPNPNNPIVKRFSAPLNSTQTFKIDTTLLDQDSGSTSANALWSSTSNNILISNADFTDGIASADIQMLLTGTSTIKVTISTDTNSEYVVTFILQTVDIDENSSGTGSGGSVAFDEKNDLTSAVVWTTVPDAYISESSVLQHVSLSSELNDLTAAVTWANVPDANITESSVTQHEAALSITESQISDLGSYLLNVLEDTTPQLGGDLDVNGNSIISTSNGDISILPNGTGNVIIGTATWNADQPLGAGQNGYVATYNDSSGEVEFQVSSGGETYFSDTFSGTAPDTTTSTLSLAIGSDASATYDNCISIGDTAVCNDSNCISIGNSSVTGTGTSKANAIAIGYYAKADGTNSVAIGGGTSSSLSANADGTQSVAIGAVASASFTQCVAVGRSATASYISCIAIGDNCIASGQSALAIGASPDATGLNSIAIGANAQSTGSSCISIGTTSSASNIASIALGGNAVANTQRSVALGFTATAPTSGLQIKVNSSTTLEMTSGGLVSLSGISAAFEMPSYATGSEPTVTAGSVIYDSTLNKLKMYNGATWETITSS